MVGRVAIDVSRESIEGISIWREGRETLTSSPPYLRSFTGFVKRGECVFFRILDTEGKECSLKKFFRVY